MRSSAERLVAALVPDHNPSGTVYGTLVVGALLAAEDPDVVGVGGLIAGVVIALSLYWLAHAYAAVAGHRLSTGARWSRQDLVAELRHEWAILRAAALPVIVVLIAVAAGATTHGAVDAGITACLVVLVGLELLAGVGTGRPARAVIWDGLVGAAMGAGLLGLKIVLH